MIVHICSNHLFTNHTPPHSNKSLLSVFLFTICLGKSRKWMVLAACIWIQAFTGTNIDFSSYSSDLKLVMGLSQVQLNYLSMASDLGKLFGWCSGVSLLYFPAWLVLFIAAFMGFLGYGLQWLVIQETIILPFFSVFLLCLLSGCSICWFNTVCYVLCIENFPGSRAFALSLSVSFSGISPALYNVTVKAINSENHALYLLLNATLPLITSIAALVPILRQRPPQDAARKIDSREYGVFLCHTILAAFTGLYLLVLNSVSYSTTTAQILLAGTIFLLVLPAFTPETVLPTSYHYQQLSSQSIDTDNLEINKQLTGDNGANAKDSRHNSCSSKEHIRDETTSTKHSTRDLYSSKDHSVILGEEHSATALISSRDFWLYYIAYFCGGTIGLAYSNNLGQVSQSLGYNSDVTELVAVYSACSFFGRLLSSAPDFLRQKIYYARTGWLAFSLVPIPIAMYLLVSSGSNAALTLATALIGLSSGFVFSTAVSITSELFGPHSTRVNHNILITGIPLGSLLYGLLAALVYETNLRETNHFTLSDRPKVCMGRKCYTETFMWWGCISMFGLVSSVLLYLRTKPAYERVERDRMCTQFL
ncbi:PREDICTED: protein NUCLEAR FUSION DEFECTIVE 4-like [Ipomoea nil]|uniref:protein NUCLEAR FUSION DEFECTIVE 4-like n=1 Tax=Ipomoea nil TaxID=35883 RepID=UPI000901DF31|nr:PREDICTED: protein NUCLEAR FUSION DEFECTIVE 4-like [Ipomoea nil]